MTEESNCTASPFKYAVVQFLNGPSKSEERYKRYIVICTKWIKHNRNQNYFYWPNMNWVQNKAVIVNNGDVDCSTWVRVRLLETVQYTNNFLEAVQTCAALHYFCIDASDHNFVEMYERIAPHFNCNDPDMNDIRKIARSIADEDEQVVAETCLSAFSHTPFEIFVSPRKVQKSVLDTQPSPTLQDRKTSLATNAETGNKIWLSPSFFSPKKEHGEISVNVVTQSPTVLDQNTSSSAAAEMANNNRLSPSSLSPTKHHAIIDYTNRHTQLSRNTLEENTSSTTDGNTANNDWQSPSFLSPRKRQAEKEDCDDDTQWSPSLLDVKVSRKSYITIRKHKAAAASRCLYVDK